MITTAERESNRCRSLWRLMRHAERKASRMVRLCNRYARSLAEETHYEDEHESFSDDAAYWRAELTAELGGRALP